MVGTDFFCSEDNLLSRDIFLRCHVSWLGHDWEIMATLYVELGEKYMKIWKLFRDYPGVCLFFLEIAKFSRVCQYYLEK